MSNIFVDIHEYPWGMCKSPTRPCFIMVLFGGCLYEGEGIFSYITVESSKDGRFINKVPEIPSGYLT